jgi:hypothetical protein
MSIEEAAMRAVENLMERPAGPLGFRFAVQPLMATLIAIRHGIRDARTGKPPYFLSILLPSPYQGAAFREGVSGTTRIMIFAMALDLIYQIYMFDAFYIGEAIVVAVLLGFLPYTLVRGPVSRLVRRFDGR